MRLNFFNRPCRAVRLITLAGTIALGLLITGSTSGNEGPERITGGGGLELAVYEAGNPDGPPILFLHGFTQNHLSWQQQFAGPLAEEFRLVAIDLRGHGASDKPLDAHHYNDSGLWANDVAAVIEAAGLDRPVLVGWSYGGYIIADYIRAHGEDAISGLVFVGAVTKAGTEEAMDMLGEEFKEVLGGVFSRDLHTNIDATRAFLRMATAEPVDRDFFEFILASAMMVPVQVRTGLFDRELDNDDVLSGIRSPALVIHGAEDELVLASSAEHIAGTVPGARLLLYEGVGHVPFVEDTKRFDRDLAEFVRAARE